ncbi:MAG: hypothetical protein ACREYA_32375 [Cupriavidus necator]
MKKREMIKTPSGLTWTAVVDLLKEHDPQGFTNSELADLFGQPYQRVASLTRVMYDAGALSRTHVGKTAGTTFYFLPL